MCARGVGGGLDPRCGVDVGGQIKTLSPMEKKGSGARGHTGRRELGGASPGRSLRKGQRSVSSGEWGLGGGGEGEIGQL